MQTQREGLFLDFEVASKTDLKAHGLARYLACPTTKPYCFTFVLPGMRQADLWELGQPIPRQILAHIAAGKTFVAHNAAFDALIWNDVLPRWVKADLPQLNLRGQVQCSAARARYNGLPGGLGRAAEALGLPLQKDREGAAAMKELMHNPEWTPATHPELFARTYKYALLDTDVMVALWEATQPMPPKEQLYWQLDLEINMRGFGVDVEAAEGMAEMAQLAQAMIDFEVETATQGKILTTSVIKQIQSFAAGLGAELDEAGRESVKALLTRDDVPEVLRDVLTLRLDASRAPKKHDAILRAHVNGRMCHSTVYHGALSGRSTAMGCGDVQLLNVARPRPGRKVKDTITYLDAARRRDYDYLSRPEVGPPLAALADAQRHLFCATNPGCILVVADLSGIEARKGPWLANDEGMLVEYEQGIDGYKVEAATIFDLPDTDAVTSDQRQIGKITRLALQFGGGDGALDNMAKAYGLELSEDLRRKIVWSYRESHPALSTWWASLEYAALIALDQPGRAVVVPIGRGLCTSATFVRDTTALRMELPSGRAISYHNARLVLEPGASAPIAVYDKPNGVVETLDRKILSNNMTQGLARDLFWEAMLSVAPVEQIVHHVYDEVILEVPEERAELRLKQLEARLSKAPLWAPGLPLGAEGFVSPYWRK
ncbi:putative DNA polymerase I [Xanthomonas phage OP2]|uniref:Putative DNA polymerase I n=1 Tax=Xanthomonas phage OP2 TaxID=331627 RepID=Q2NP77_9CAUD|nr:DNA polymerase [Xanthomonas phage OP2]BAE72819.1 putative DNA polymerase I [Xanthomonas phage OP2]